MPDPDFLPIPDPRSRIRNTVNTVFVQGEEAEGGDAGEGDPVPDQGRLERQRTLLCKTHLLLPGDVTPSNPDPF